MLRGPVLSAHHCKESWTRREKRRARSVCLCGVDGLLLFPACHSSSLALVLAKLGTTPKKLGNPRKTEQNTDSNPAYVKIVLAPYGSVYSLHLYQPWADLHQGCGGGNLYSIILCFPF